jgi:hypothetical protein
MQQGSVHYFIVPEKLVLLPHSSFTWTSLVFESDVPERKFLERGGR